jgi:hypothetical protein
MPMLAPLAGSKAQAAAESSALPQVAITLTSEGIVAAPSALKGGNYLVTITNSTSEPRGTQMTGVDRAASPWVRYTRVLKPGETETFRWYFAKGKTVHVRDVLRWKSAQGNILTARFGQMGAAIDVD